MKEEIEKNKSQKSSKDNNSYVNESKTKKLVYNLLDKKNYICNIRNLQYYLKNGVVLKKIHKIVKYKHSAWLKPYIDFNTNQRKNSKNDAEKDFWKLLNNSVYGKFLQNDRNHADITLTTDVKKYNKIANSKFFKNKIDINDDLKLLERFKSHVKLNKPIQVGAIILDYAKQIMYEHFYKLKDFYNDKIKLLYMDTDSLIYHVQTDDVYEDIIKQKDLYDLSNYDKGFKTISGKNVFDATNKAVYGKFKNEIPNDEIIEFITVRSKVYSFISEKEISKQKIKGVKKSAMKNIKHEDFKSCLFNNTTKFEKFNCIKSKNHKLSTVQQKKISLCGLCDKKYLINSVYAYSYGNFEISKMNFFDC